MSDLEWNPLFLPSSSVVSGLRWPCRDRAVSSALPFRPCNLWSAIFAPHLGQLCQRRPDEKHPLLLYYSKNPPEYFYSSATTTVSEIRDQQHRLRTFDVLLSQGRVPRGFYDSFDQGWSRNGSLDPPTMLHDACFKDSAAHLYLNIRCLFWDDGI